MVERSSNGMEKVPSSFIVCCTTWFWNWTTIRHVFCILQEFDAGANTVAQWLKKWYIFYTLMKIAAHFQTLKKPLISTFSLISAAFSVLLWRREGDLNPARELPACWYSKPVPSASWVPLHIWCQIIHEILPHHTESFQGIVSNIPAGDISEIISNPSG